MEIVKDFIFLASKIAADNDCSHEIKRHLLLGKAIGRKEKLGIKSRQYIKKKRHDFADKVMSLLFNKQSSLVKTFLPRSKCLLISWLQSPSAVILEPKKIKSDFVSTVSPSISHEVMGLDTMILVF